MSDVNHQQLLDRFDGKKFKQYMNHMCLIQAIVNYHLLKNKHSELTIENFEKYFPESSVLGVYSHESESQKYRIDYSFEKEMFQFYLNDELYIEKQGLLLEQQYVEENQDKDFIQAQDFNLLSNALLHQKNLDLILNNQMIRKYYYENPYGLYSQIFPPFYSLENEERDDDLDGMKNRFDSSPYLNKYQIKEDL